METLLAMLFFAVLVTAAELISRRRRRDPLAEQADRALTELRMVLRKHAVPHSLTRLNTSTDTPPLGVAVMPDIEERTRKVAANGARSPLATPLTRRR